MMISKTEAIVLRIAAFSKTSQIVTWLTRDHGKVVTVVKGACRPKSAFLGQYDLFYTCELLFYARESNGIHIAKECTPLNTRRTFRLNWRACCAASYVCDLTSRCSLAGESSEELYLLTTQTLELLASGHADARLLLWFELSLLRTLGMAPQFMTCAACGRKASLSATPFFSAALGGIACSRCVQRVQYPDPRLDGGTLALFRRWAAAHNGRQAVITPCRSDQLVAMERILGIFLMFHVDASTESRRVAFDAVRPKPD